MRIVELRPEVAGARRHSRPTTAIVDLESAMRAAGAGTPVARCARCCLEQPDWRRLIDQAFARAAARRAR